MGTKPAARRLSMRCIACLWASNASQGRAVDGCRRAKGSPRCLAFGSAGGARLRCVVLGQTFDDTIDAESISQGDAVNQIIYLVGLVVVVIAILSFMGIM